MTEFLSCRPGLEVRDLEPRGLEPRGLRDFVAEVPGGRRLALGERIAAGPGAR